MNLDLDLRTFYTTPDKLQNDAPILIPCPYHNDTKDSRAVYRLNTFCFGGCPDDRKFEGFFECYRRVKGENYDGHFSFNFNNNNNVDSNQHHPTSLLDVHNTYKVGTFSLQEVELYHQLLLSRYGPRKQWLYDRGINFDTIEREKLGHTGISFTIPIWDFEGSGCLTLRHRNDDLLHSGSKYWGSPGKNQIAYMVGAHAIEAGGTAVLCESELCAILLNQEYLEGRTDYVGISLINGIRNYTAKNFIPYLPLLLLLDRLVIAVDQDTASRNKWDALGAWLTSQGVKTYLTEWVYLNEKDVSEVISHRGIETFNRLLEKAVKYSRRQD